MWGLSTVRGSFAAYQGTLRVAGPGMRGEVTIDPRSLHTGNRRRDQHLRSPAFFDAERYPQIRLEITAGAMDEVGLNIDGDLQIATVRLPIQVHLDIEQMTAQTVSLHAALPLSRTEAGITWDKLSMTRDRVDVEARLTLTRSSQ